MNDQINRRMAKSISYQEFVKALLKMWLDNLISATEFYRILDILNLIMGDSNEE